MWAELKTWEITTMKVEYIQSNFDEKFVRNVNKEEESSTKDFKESKLIEEKGPKSKAIIFLVQEIYQYVRLPVF